MNRTLLLSLIILFGLSLSAVAQKDRNMAIIRSSLHGLEYEVKAGFSIGGTAPLPHPPEIRSIDGFRPTVAITLDGTATKW